MEKVRGDLVEALGKKEQQSQLTSWRIGNKKIAAPHIEGFR